jgi:hypothetical protein
MSAGGCDPEKPVTAASPSVTMPAGDAGCAKAAPEYKAEHRIDKTANSAARGIRQIRRPSPSCKGDEDEAASKVRMPLALRIGHSRQSEKDTPARAFRVLI